MSKAVVALALAGIALSTWALAVTWGEPAEPVAVVVQLPSTTPTTAAPSSTTPERDEPEVEAVPTTTTTERELTETEQMVRDWHRALGDDVERTALAGRLAGHSDGGEAWRDSVGQSILAVLPDDMALVGLLVDVEEIRVVVGVFCEVVAVEGLASPALEAVREGSSSGEVFSRWQDTYNAGMALRLVGYSAQQHCPNQMSVGRLASLGISG